VATALAASGFTGPETVLEGTHGLYAAFAGGHDAARLEALLDTSAVTGSWPSSPSSRIVRLHCPAYMDCAMRLRARTSFRPGDIRASRAAPPPVPCPGSGSP